MVLKHEQALESSGELVKTLMLGPLPEVQIQIQIWDKDREFAFPTISQVTHSSPGTTLRESLSHADMT